MFNGHVAKARQTESKFVGHVAKACKHRRAVMVVETRRNFRAVPGGPLDTDIENAILFCEKYTLFVAHSPAPQAQSGLTNVCGTLYSTRSNSMAHMNAYPTQPPPGLIVPALPPSTFAARGDSLCRSTSTMLTRRRYALNAGGCSKRKGISVVR